MGACEPSGAASHRGNSTPSPSAQFMRMLQAGKDEVIFSPFCKTVIFFGLVFVFQFCGVFFPLFWVSSYSSPVLTSFVCFAVTCVARNRELLTCQELWGQCEVLTREKEGKHPCLSLW